VLAQPAQEGERDHDVRRLFFAINVTDAEKEAFEERFGVTLINGYGLSEGMTLLTCAPIVGPRRWPSIGLPSPGKMAYSFVLKRRLRLLSRFVPQGTRWSGDAYATSRSALRATLIAESDSVPVCLVVIEESPIREQV
jgi:acyl-CoA synthetase (AMP-forming)/AMP-acid ligase II